MTRIIISGSRNFSNREFLYQTMDKVIQENNLEDIEIVSGGAIGADALAEAYARTRRYPITVFTAQWLVYGKSAGFIRNQQMANYAKEADKAVLVAFPIGESRGTRDMIKRAKSEGFEVFCFDG